MKTNFVFSIPPAPLRLGVIEACNIKVKPSSDKYRARICREVEPILDPGFVYPDQMRKGIRSLLRSTGFHPSGRSRPASEFLFKDLLNRKEFNFINNVVDINNHLSLCHHIPISTFDMDKTGTDLCIRTGLEDETYIFNQEGQTLSLKKMLVVSRHGNGSSAFGSPIKDSQDTKVFSDTRNILAVIYTSSNITPADELARILSDFTALLSEETGAESVESGIIEENS